MNKSWIFIIVGVISSMYISLILTSHFRSMNEENAKSQGPILFDDVCTRNFWVKRWLSARAKHRLDKSKLSNINQPFQIDKFSFSRFHIIFSLYLRCYSYTILHMGTYVSFYSEKFQHEFNMVHVLSMLYAWKKIKINLKFHVLYFIFYSFRSIGIKCSAQRKCSAFFFIYRTNGPFNIGAVLMFGCSVILLNRWVSIHCTHRPIGR